MSHLEKEITGWFKKNKRDLPWRKTNAWGVLVSEIMLQQTPVARVEPIWHTWMKLWPTPKDLAAATPAEVDAFHAAGLAAGGADEGQPGPRGHLPGAYAAYLRDPAGNKITAYTFI